MQPIGGAEFIVEEGTAANTSLLVHTFAATDVSGGAVSWSVGGTNSAIFEIDATGALSFQDGSKPAYDAGGANTYEITVEASDAGGHAHSMNVSIEITDATPPAITGPTGGAGDATSTISVDEMTSGTITTFSATDASNVVWSLGTGGDNGDFVITQGGELLFRQEKAFANPTGDATVNDYVAEVIATDATGRSSTQTITVTVLDDRAPDFMMYNYDDLDEAGKDAAPQGVTGYVQPMGGAEFIVEEGTAANTSLLVHTFAATDVSGGAVSWSVGGTNAAIFEIDANGALSFQDGSKPAYDAGGANTYEITVEASDAGGHAHSMNVSIEITDATPPAITGPTGAAGAATSTISVDEMTSGTITTFSATDASNVVWSLGTGGDNGDFVITQGGELLFRQEKAFANPTGDATVNDYVAEVIATDATGRSSTQTITVTVLDDRAPDFMMYNYDDLDQAGKDAAPQGVTGYVQPMGGAEFIVEEGTAANTSLLVHTFTATDVSGGAVSWSVGGTNAAIFEIDANGALSFQDGSKPAYDAGGANTYEITVEASDAGGHAHSMNVSIEITDATPPAITGPTGAAGAATSTISVDEMTSGTITTFSATDASNVVWSLGTGGDNGDFVITQGGELLFRQEKAFANPTGDAAVNDYVAEVIATDATGRSSTQTITVTVLDDRAPDFMMYNYDDLDQAGKDAAPQGVTGYVQPMGGAEFIVEEGTTANTSLLVHTFAATDVSGGAVSHGV